MLTVPALQTIVSQLLQFVVQGRISGVDSGFGKFCKRSLVKRVSKVALCVFAVISLAFYLI